MFNAKEAVSRRVLQQILVLPILVVWVKVENKVLKTQSKYSPYCRLFILEILKETYEEECSKLKEIKAQYLKEKTKGLSKFL